MRAGTGEVVWWPKDEAVAKRLDAPEATPPVPDDVMVMAQVCALRFTLLGTVNYR